MLILGKNSSALINIDQFFKTQLNILVAWQHLNSFLQKIHLNDVYRLPMESVKTFSHSQMVFMVKVVYFSSLLLSDILNSNKRIFSDVRAEFGGDDTTASLCGSE